MRGFPVFLSCLIGLIFCISSQAYAQQTVQAEAVPGELIVKYRPGFGIAQMENRLSSHGLEIIHYYPQVNLYHCKVKPDVSIEAAVQNCENDPDIIYAEPNYIYHTMTRQGPTVTPNDPRFDRLWGLNNGNDADIDAPEAWEVTTGSRDILVAIIDTGVDYDHEDLKDNIWHNPGETGDGKETNGVDDDGNGYVDDWRGWNFILKSNDPWDDNGHGTHVAGTVGAVGNNGKGVVGVNWQVSLMPLKFLDRNGSGTLADAIPAIIYAADMGAHVLSNSWGGGGFSQALKDAIEYARGKGALFVAAAGNESNDNDRSANYPSNYEVDNVVAVAASDQGDRLANFSNYGETTVDLAAPGVNILSTKPRDQYQSLNGTSMATPHVSGVAALIWAKYPNLTYRQVFIRLMGSVDRKSAFIGRTVTGGRLNAAKALSTNPLVGFVTQWKNTPDTSGPYQIIAEVTDDGSIATVKLVYSLNGGSSQSVTMQNVGTDTYSGSIPGQPLETNIAYYVEATDDAGNTGRSHTVNFRITTEPSDGNGCCGALGFSFNGAESVPEKGMLAALNVAFLMGLVWLVGRRRRK